MRDRREDILLLAENFLERFSQRLQINRLRLDDSAKQALLRYSWPGNVRELENAIERACLLCQSDTVTTEAEHECEESLHRLAGSLGLYGYGQMEQHCRAYLMRLRTGEPINGMASAILEFSDQLLQVRARPQNTHLS